MVKNKCKRDTYRYELKHGKKVIYVGITTDHRKRRGEHKVDGKKFTHMNVIGPKVCRDTAENWEEKRLKMYRRGHRGRNPKYNRTDE